MSATRPFGLATARDAIDAALATGRALNARPLTVVALDAGGHVIASQREDGSGIVRFEIAFAKAWGALGMGMPSRAIEQLALERPAFAGSACTAASGRIVLAAGGVLVLDADDGTVTGAIGISGDTSDVDEACALAGLRAAGCRSLPAGDAEASA